MLFGPLFGQSFRSRGPAAAVFLLHICTHIRWWPSRHRSTKERTGRAMWKLCTAEERITLPSPQFQEGGPNLAQNPTSTTISEHDANSNRTKSAAAAGCVLHRECVLCLFADLCPHVLERRFELALVWTNPFLNLIVWVLKTIAALGWSTNLNQKS